MTPCNDNTPWPAWHADATVRRFSAAAVLIGLVLSGCTGSADRFAPQFATYRQAMHTLLLLQPEVRFFEQLPDGSRLFQDIESQAAGQQLQRSIARQLQQHGFAVATADAQTMGLPGVAEVASLYRSVNHAIRLHTFGPQIYPAKVKEFDYRLGSISEILQASQADGLVLAIGYQAHARPAAQNWLAIAVVEPAGRIVWYARHSAPGKFDLRCSDGIDRMVAGTMAHFTEPGT